MEFPRDLHDWMTRFGSQQQRISARLARPAPRPPSAGKHVSGARLGWRDLGFEQLEIAAGATVPAARPGQHAVLVGLGCGRLSATRAGEMQACDVRPGTVLLLPADAGATWKAQTALHCCLVFLDAHVLTRTAESAYQASATDFEVVQTRVDYDFGIIGLAGVLAEEARRGARGNNLYVNSLAAHLAVHLLRHYARWRRAGPDAERLTAFTRALKGPEAVQRAVVHIRENHTRDIGAQEIAHAAGENPFVLKRLFYENLGTEPGQYVLQLRMQSAESLMAAGARSLPDVAAAVGFGNPAALVGNGAADRAERGLQSA